MENCTDNRKRDRDELDVSLADSAESKLRRLDSTESRFVKPCSKSEPVGSDGDDLRIDLADSDEIQDKLLNILEDSDVVAERDESIQGFELDSFIRSFEEEIHALPPAETLSDQNETPQAELGYLFEASDDELGLPPTVGSSNEGKIEAIDFTPACSWPGVFEMDGNVGFEDEIPCYDSFEIGIGIGSGLAEENGLGGEFVALGGLFDYSDVPFRPESLSAL
ncbi:uncharacterized protein LOC111801944 [Cucurbita pepo subsp. pepo]|uniref:uncharacterized protein LOC111801944 n=1 Tax=Cucurbita pepo subsp. pepo TaxID=3664 RepID=UPI000C9D64B8|nr:uncharacterized protein LOC111801944 [Cucurbita pepo subsp. pepo]